MNALIYIYTATNGETREIKSYQEVITLVNSKGGHYKAVCRPIPEKVCIFPKALERRVSASARQPTH